jgi:2-oxoglutarate dehydrogenase E1 component
MTMEKYAYLNNAHGDAIEELYQRYRRDNSSVDYSWQKFFEGFDFAADNENGIAAESFAKEINVLRLIDGYRSRGHLFTVTNPVRARREYEPTLALETFGLSQADLDTEFRAGLELGLGQASLRSIREFLEQTYRGSIGAEYRYIRKPEELSWLTQRLEGNRNTPAFTAAEKKHILEDLNDAVAFERYLHTKFVGQKRFSLEGMEALIPALDMLIEYGAECGAADFVIGMAHRGRLNVLANIMDKPLEDIFSEFEGDIGEDAYLEDDVKYHLGYTANKKSHNGRDVHIRLVANPSHLESVDPVVEGISRAKLDIKHGGDNDKLIPVLVHGDASLAGQGVVYEVIQMSRLRGYSAGGTIHIATNNQVGFTTNYLDGRSSTYCTDVAKVTLSPVFHVNADDVEAVLHVMQIAVDYRQKFNKDVFIDLLGYRKYGHNEGDEPRYTQPLLYELIASHANVRDIYAEQLKREGVLSAAAYDELIDSHKSDLDKHFAAAKKVHKQVVRPFMKGPWLGFRLPKKSDFRLSPETGVAENLLRDLGVRSVSIPEDLPVFPKIRKLFAERRAMLEESGRLDWGTAELLAYASLVAEGTPVRISGQDVERGTFAHRHAVLTRTDSEERYVPLQHVNKQQASFQIYNSLLSEYAVLGFEFGYSMATPLGLTIWEAQFGDFANGAQIIFDQYISSSGIKWQRMSGLTVLLPHGFEGQGPEHSSGRIERMLELCASYNMAVCNPTTPANLFHMLRRQVVWPFRMPLIVFTPKSLLRHPRVKSPLRDFSHGRFQEVIGDERAAVDKVRKILFCSGKVYYDLLAFQEEKEIDDVAIVRVEQLHPLPQQQLLDVVRRYRDVRDWVWVQEEPENMGAWAYILRHLRDWNIQYVGRPDRASPATGSAKVHAREQAAIVEAAFAR